ncbi:uncharacterized protein BDR25DRAFT_294329 [Lindgomyces ingoldianus]|uniref:Uncharacterized protein n=1 Tax=Lindgomyces ingoldianus TaxID=673940 RepID=A0ACB6QJ90_9PLEO|nr:uncharacterized protein BDR25DRAFT_294329 [Lindgomyces ingoldianus]KAF2466192.1 hypothetical protein BDR25DRAFT_294329 [Lindgomyces ingoldianus]
MQQGVVEDKLQSNVGFEVPTPRRAEQLSNSESQDAHLFSQHMSLESESWKDIQTQLPDSWMWDVDYHSIPNTSGQAVGCWTCTPMNDDDPRDFPLTIAGAPVVIPVEHRWPPIAGVNPPPDPRPSTPIDCTAELPLEVVRDLFLTFQGSMGFYVLINGLLQIIVPKEFDTEWASSHLPHKYGGLRICYIPQCMIPTMTPSKTEIINSKSSQGSGLSSRLGLFRPSSSLLVQTHRLNDFIEARTKSTLKEGRFSGRIGLRTSTGSESYLVMSTHVITEAILSKSNRLSIFSRKRNSYENLESDWNEHVEIWAGNELFGTVDKSFDTKAKVYPNGFIHDITLIKPTNPAAVKDIKSPIPDIGWLSREAWNGLRQQSSTVKFLGDTENEAKTLKTNRPSEVLVVGEGIFLNQTASVKPSRGHDIGVWKDFVSRCLLYRVHKDFDTPNGHSGIALYADGLREDGTTGPGIVGFQSFVQRSGHVQNFKMEGGALERRLKLGRVAFYGAFQVPDELRKAHTIA